ncbi:CAP domain-containing protein [Streptomyces xanthophaeus]|uniref:CAP domain-containing protein n=1 Tax=Streptomyces xanthophaeus TaxID=67385 RepID=UPI00264949EB|nr:CAP domain-containing protein [Streptomyces xanthophaeus]WKD34943.1 CAP domain-containing protein [Streptomyces xanthophaeus]
MQKHRKKSSYKKIVIGVGALALVGVPTAAMACFDGQDNGNGNGWTRTASHQQQRPWQWQPTPSATPSTLAPVDAPLPATSPSSSPAEASPSSPAETAAAPVVETTPPAQQPKPKPPVATTKPQAPAPSKPAAAPASGEIAQVLALVNKERASAGCQAVSLNAKLTKAAQDHSADMASHSNMSHTGSDGSDPGARITRAGYTWSTYGENVAYGYSTPEKVMEGWMNSQGHRENILNCSFKEIGIGLAQPGYYWTQDFGTAR